MRRVLSNALVAVLLLALAVSAARSHSWYESGCCSGLDCAPVEEGRIVEKPDGVHVQGYGVLNRSDPRIRWSRDDQDHLCETQYAPRKLLCIYLRPKGM